MYHLKLASCIYICSLLALDMLYVKLNDWSIHLVGTLSTPLLKVFWKLLFYQCHLKVLPSVWRDFFVFTKWHLLHVVILIRRFLRTSYLTNVTNTYSTKHCYTTSGITPLYYVTSFIIYNLFGSFAESRWAYAIMNCPLCVVVGVVIIIVVIIVIVCGQSSCLQVWSQKLYILHIYAHMPLVYAHELVNTSWIF